MSKQDRQGARTVSDLERKYGERFADVYGMATGARVAAEEAKEIAAEAKDNPNIDHEAVFNALTEDGKCQGLYRADDGKIYINAEYIKSGVFFGEVEIFLEPTQQELEKINKHIAGTQIITASEIPLYDFNGDGAVTSEDRALCAKSVEDGIPLGDFPAKKLSTVRIKIDVRNPGKAISFTATNMWGRKLDFAIGVHSGIFIDDNMRGLYRIVDGEKEWLSPPMLDGVGYRTTERNGGYPVYKKALRVEFSGSGSMTIDTKIDKNSHTILGANYMFNDTAQVFFSGSNGVSASLKRVTTSNYYQLIVTAPSNGVFRIEIKYL